MLQIPDSHENIQHIYSALQVPSNSSVSISYPSSVLFFKEAKLNSSQESQDCILLWTFTMFFLNIFNNA